MRCLLARLKNCILFPFIPVGVETLRVELISEVAVDMCQSAMCMGMGMGDLLQKVICGTQFKSRIISVTSQDLSMHANDVRANKTYLKYYSVSMR